MDMNNSYYEDYQYGQKKYYTKCNDYSTSRYCDGYNTNKCPSYCDEDKYWDDCCWNCDDNYPNTGSQTSQMQLQLENQSLLEIAAGANVVFDKRITPPTTSMEYDPATGNISIRESGVYYVDWWVATESTIGGSNVFVGFGVTSSQGYNIKAFNYNTNGQVVGNAILTVDVYQRTPVIVKLVNAIDGAIAYGQVPIKANLTIIKASSN